MNKINFNFKISLHFYVVILFNMFIFVVLLIFLVNVNQYQKNYLHSLYIHTCFILNESINQSIGTYTAFI